MVTKPTMIDDILTDVHMWVHKGHTAGKSANITILESMLIVKMPANGATDLFIHISEIASQVDNMFAASHANEIILTRV